MPPKGIMAIGPGDWEEIGRTFLRAFRELAGLQPHERVLDIGCGVGRIAVPLTAYLSTAGSYEGFDIDPRGIRWAQRHITRSHPSFRFQVADIANSTYNPKGSVRAEDFVFPYPDESFDFAFATSVLTHLLPEEARRYLSETRRILKPGGRTLMTSFLLNDASLNELTRGRSHLEFPHDRGNYRLMDSGKPDMNVAYSEELIRMMIANAQLAIREPIRFGAWSGWERCEVG